MAKFNIKVGDTAPDLQATLKNSDGSVIDLSAAAAVLFHMREKGSTTAKVERAAEIVLPATNGVVKYVWQTADTDTEGTFEGEFEITFNDGSISTVPNNSYIEIPMKTEIA